MSIDPVRLFTVREANALIRKLREFVGELADIRDSILKVQGKVEVLHLLHGKNVLREDHIDHGEYQEHRQHLERLVREFNNVIAKISESGAVMKDVDMGLIDFHAERRGQLVYLCWQTEEPEVGYWHPLQGGYAARQPIESPDVDEDEPAEDA